MAVLAEPVPQRESLALAVARASRFPRLRYMGSKYKVVPALVDVFASLEFDTVLDAFSGSGVVGYALKAMGKQVTTNDFLAFAATIARATIANSTTQLAPDDVDRILSPNADGRNFIAGTFRGLYFPPADLAFLDAAWSHIDLMEGPQRDLAIASLCLAAARKQPRGVFTVTDLRYDDGRRQLHTPLADLFVEAVAEYNAAVFDTGRPNQALCGDVFDVHPARFDVVYLDPPYAPPRDDNCYIKRYHFLEGLAVYWRGQRILQSTKSKKLEKRYTPFSYKTTIREALASTFRRFRRSTIVLSYSSNSVPDHEEVVALLQAEKPSVEVLVLPHRYSFGTHSTALRRQASEYIFVAR
jgi:DNA adenine methylase/adenine-specific DNA-methyltransferase